MEKFCCLNSKEILENSKFQKLNINDYSSQKEKRDSATQLPISYIKSLPEPELRIIFPQKTKIKQHKNLLAVNQEVVNERKALLHQLHAN